jgi:protein-tyrosine kinase
MSRIHEALKKAEQERATQRPDEAANPPAERFSLGVSGGAGIGVTDDPVLSPSPSRGFLRFEDLQARCSKVRWHLDPRQNVFLDPDAATHGAEQFRTLRSRLYQLRGGQTLRTILVTSSIPGEGKTYVANNLAQAIVRQPDRRALIIDADLRRPRLHLLLGTSVAPGLTEYLRGEVDEPSVIQCGQESSLSFIPGGNDVTNPSELLANGRLKNLLERVSPFFDWVILDSPPCVPVADASMIAEVCDGVLVVVRYGLTPTAVARKAVQELQGKNVLGVVLNATEEAGQYESYYYESYGDGAQTNRGADGPVQTIGA